MRSLTAACQKYTLLRKYSIRLRAGLYSKCIGKKMYEALGQPDRGVSAG